MRPPAASALLLALCVLGVPRGALAVDGDEVDALIKQGLVLRRQGRDTEALGAFRSANALRPTSRGLAQVALAEQALGKWVEAERDLVRALDARDDPWIQSNRGLLESGLAAIRSHLGWLMVSGDVPGAELWVNDMRAGTLPLGDPLRLEAGSAVIEVRAPGYAPARRITGVEPGGSAREEVRLVPIAGPAPTGAPTDSSPAGAIANVAPSPRALPPNLPMRHAAYVALGAGAVGLAAGAYFGVRTFDDKSQRDAICSPEGCSSRYGVALDKEARTLALASTAWFVAGGIAAATGAGLIWMSRSGTASASGSAMGRLTLSPEVGPDRAGVRVGGFW